MAVGLPIGTVRMMKEYRKLVAKIKVSHHGKFRDRWQSTNHRPEASVKGKIQDVLKNRAAAEKRRVKQAAAMKTSNVDRARAHWDTIRRGAFYLVIHGIPSTYSVFRGFEGSPLGLMVRVPCRTKHQAELLAQRPEFGGVQFEVLRGQLLISDQATLVRLAGYHWYVPDDGQAWVQKRTLERLAASEGPE